MLCDVRRKHKSNLEQQQSISPRLTATEARRLQQTDDSSVETDE